MPLAAKVLIDGPSELIFDYAIPDNLPVQAGCRVHIPLRNRKAIGTVLSVGNVEPDGFTLKPITSLIDPEPLLTPGLMKLARWMTNYYGTPLELIMRSLIPNSVRQESHSAKTRKIVTLTNFPDEESLAQLERRAPRQHVILTLLKEVGTLPLKDLGGGGVLASVRTLVKSGYLSLTEETVHRDPDAQDEFLETKPFPLNPGQQAAFEAIREAMDTPASETSKPILLHGITGSGKTEVYLQAAQHALDQGKSVIVLVPEISLTPQTVQHFKSRFAALQDAVAVIHSHLSQGERFDEWHRLRKGSARIVVGARSAVFAPLPNLGLILVDEEHENTYKQESPPRYQGRDIAVVRGHIENCPVVLGSATPSLESYQNARSGKYKLVNLTERADGASLPLIRVVDMRIEARKQKAVGLAILSEKLRQAMNKRLEQGEQTILFLNRRGFARSLQCPSCGEVCECQHCALPLTYHRSEERLMCHLCGFQAIVPRKCIPLQRLGCAKPLPPAGCQDRLSKDRAL